MSESRLLIIEARVEHMLGDGNQPLRLRYSQGRQTAASQIVGSFGRLLFCFSGALVRSPTK
jgi:hypothetical protein